MSQLLDSLAEDTAEAFAADPRVSLAGHALCVIGRRKEALERVCPPIGPSLHLTIASMAYHILQRGRKPWYRLAKLI